MNAFSFIGRDMFGPVPDRSPIDMPPAAARNVMMAAAAQLKLLGAQLGSRQVVALADAMEEAASGETEAACEALNEAAALRRMRA